MNGKIVPAFQVIETNVDLPQISVSIHGNFISKIANAFKKFFMGTVKKAIVNNVKSQISSHLAQELNKLVAAEKGFSELYKGMDLDWSIPKAPVVTNAQLELAMKGLFFPKNQGEVEPTQ